MVLSRVGEAKELKGKGAGLRWQNVTGQGEGNRESETRTFKAWEKIVRLFLFPTPQHRPLYLREGTPFPHKMKILP